MKRLVIIGLLLCCCSTLWAQKERNVLGAPVYYDTLGNVIGSKTPADSLYHRPKHHFHNRLENEFCALFLEGKTLFASDDMALGGQLAWVPRRWGVYGSGSLGFTRGYFSAGPVWRMSDCGQTIDWQLYGGLVMSHRMGGEVGLRIGAPKLWGDFCWTSFSLTLGHVDRINYVSLGFSITLTSIVALTIW